MKPSPEDIIQAIYEAADKGLRVVVVGGPSLGTVDLGGASLAALEEVQVNVTGEGGIATEATLAALLALLTPGPSKHVAVLNPTKNAVLEVSFDGGVSFVQVIGTDTFSIPCRVSSIQVRTTTGPLPFGVIATV